MTEFSTKTFIPSNITTTIMHVSNRKLPDASRDKYLQVYKKFMTWRADKNINSFSENVMLTYFDELSETMAPNTLWSQYSMLKSTLYLNDKVDLKKYSKLIDFLKQSNAGYHCKKSKVFSYEDIELFINEAPDYNYLDTKVALIVGITGACRREELCNITINDIIDCDSSSLLHFKLPKMKTHMAKSFTITGKFYKIVKKYKDLRPVPCKSDKFFINYQKGKCLQQNIGINKLGGMPKKIANFLKLPNPELYTGHTFRRTSASLLAEAGADLTTLKCHRSCDSNQVTESNIEDSLGNEKKISDKITENIHVVTTDLIDNDSSLLISQKNITDSEIVNNIKIEESSIITGAENEEISIERNPDTSIGNFSNPLKNITLTFNNCNNITFNFNEN